ncbi:MAG: alpha/beta hydrolase [Balneolaceae bacterium]
MSVRPILPASLLALVVSCITLPLHGQQVDRYVIDVAVFPEKETLAAQTVLTLNAPEKKPDSTFTFTVQTYDGLNLPAQVLNPGNVEKKMILFINGSTPYDEKGNLGAFWTDEGKIITQRHDLTLRFLDIMSNKGYPIATMAKRSFVYPTKIPRPTFSDLAFDIQFFIEALKSTGLLKDEKELVLVGYSEGSVVASKVLGILKKQPHASVLLGSATMGVGTNCNDPLIEDFKMTDVLRRLKDWDDEQIETELNQICQIQNDLLNMDEEEFETEYKKSNPYGFGFAMWESFYIDRKSAFYDPVPNLLYANTPLLIVIGENDTSMPRKSAKNTYERLLTLGFDKAKFKTIDNEVHQYKKYDLFPIIDTWLTSKFQSTEFTLQKSDSLMIRKYAEASELVNEINAFPYKGGTPEKIISIYNKASEKDLNDARSWFTLGLKLFANDFNPEAYSSFVKASDSTFAAYFAPLVWRGHLKDLQNQRTEAVSLYKQALNAYPGFPMQHAQWDMIIDKNWIKARIKVPFQGVP